jgi:hypothetical protein
MDNKQPKSNNNSFDVINDISSISRLNESAMVENSLFVDIRNQSPEPSHTMNKRGVRQPITLDVISDEDESNDGYHKTVMSIMAEADTRLNDLQL